MKRDFIIAVLAMLASWILRAIAPRADLTWFVVMLVMVGAIVGLSTWLIRATGPTYDR